MTSGKLKTPRNEQCLTCNTDMLTYGNRPKQYCSTKCRYPDRFRTTPKRTPEQIAEYNRDKARDKYAKHKAIVTAYKLKQGHCHDCQMPITDTTIVCIDLDHRDPTNKHFTIAYKMSSVSTQRLIDELNKCDAVCRNCHAYRTHNGKHWANILSSPMSNKR